MHEVLDKRLGGLSLLRKSVVSLTDRPDMTIAVNRGRETTTQQQQIEPLIFYCICICLLKHSKHMLKIASLIYFVVSEINIVIKFR